MKLQIIGVGSGLDSFLGDTSMLLWKGERAILLDCGTNVFNELLKIEEESEKEIIKHIDTVFISHPHADHIGSLGKLLGYRYYRCGGLMTKITGATQAVKDYLQITKPISDGNVILDVSLAEGIDLMTTEHIPGMYSTSCLIDGELFYTGDTGLSMLNSDYAKVAKLIVHNVASENIPLIGHRNCTQRFIHIGIDSLANSTTAEIRAKTWLAHYSEDALDFLYQRVDQYKFAGLLEKGMVLEI